MRNVNLGALIFGVLFILCGLLFAAGRIHSHLTVWKQMPEEEKINTVLLCRNIGAVILLSGILFLLDGVWPEFREHWFSGAMAVWLIAAGADLFLIHKSSRYKVL